jgi:hypothetical protein
MRHSLSVPASLVLLTSVLHAQAPLYDVSGLDNENLGWGLAALGDIDGDGAGDYLAGAPFGIGQVPAAGLAYVYSGKTAQPILTLLGEKAGDRFGYSVAGLGDLDGDGKPDIAVGATGHEPSGGDDRGAVYVFSSANGALLKKHVGLFDNDQYGWRVLGAYDVDLDGVGDYAVSAPHGNSILGGADIGFVYVYSGATHAQIRTYWGTAAGDRLGYDIDSAGDVDGDHVPDLVVGAPGYTIGANNTAGAGYVVSGALDGLVTGADVLQVLGSGNGELGFAVAGIRDINGDSVREVAFGEPGHALPVANSGAVRIFNPLTGGLVIDIGGSDGERLGFSVAGIDDFDGDGRGDLVVGRPFNDSGGLVDNGRFTVYRIWGGVTELMSWWGYQDFEMMGWTVASAGDLNFDGTSEVVAATPFSSMNFPSGGRLRLHLGGTPAPTNYCTAKVNSAGCTPDIYYTGSASKSLGFGLQVVAQNVLPGLPGILIWAKSPNALPFMGGTLCIGSPLTRAGAQVSGTISGPPCTGQYLFQFNAAYMSANGLDAGQDVYAQYWSRDTGFAAPNNVGLTSGLHFRIAQ